MKLKSVASVYLKLYMSRLIATLKISEGTLLISCAAKQYKIPIVFRYVLPLESKDVMKLSVVYIKRLLQSRWFNFDTSSL